MAALHAPGAPELPATNAASSRLAEPAAALAKAGPVTHPYAPYYCEENVWQLCDHPRIDGHPRAVIVLSNAERRMAILHQRASPDPQLPVFWDYHVVLATRRAAGWAVWDPDCTLGMPVVLPRYLEQCLAYPAGWPAPYTARARVVEASRYQAVLATDRSHMRDPAGQLRAPAPPWGPIGEGSNLMRFVQLDEPFEGEVVELSALPDALARLERDA